ncbi:MAG TPA: RDD family protein [Verrucomicrobiae bacterium]
MADQTGEITHCHYCGRAAAPEALQCSGCGLEIEARQPQVVKLTQATVRRRYLARLIDILLGVALCYLATKQYFYFIFHVLPPRFLPLDWQMNLSQFSFLFVILAFLGRISYHVCCEVIGGATLGKRCCQLQVVNQDNTTCGIKGAVIRSLGFLLDGQFFGLVGINQMHKNTYNERFGDKWGKTRVLLRQELPPSALPSSERFHLGWLLGVLSWLTLIWLALFLQLYCPQMMW